MKAFSSGIDIVDIARFAPYAKNNAHVFLKKAFTNEEIAYAFSRSLPEVHLAGMFAAKEAVSKAMGTEKFPFAEIEIRHEKTGKPIAYHKGKKLAVSVSIAHTDTIATAVAVA